MPGKIAIITRHARYLGGVELFNQLLISALEQEGFQTELVTQESLRDGAVTRLRARVFGWNRLLAAHFAKHHEATTDAVVCVGEFGLGVDHPAAICAFHGCYFGYAEALKPYVSARGHRVLMRLADEQKRAAEGKYVVTVSRAVADILGRQGVRVDAVIDNSVDTDRFRPAPGRPRNQRCLFVGSPDHWAKGFDILEGVAALGVPVDCVTSKAPRDPRLGWLQSVPNDRLPEYYQSYQVLLHPSRFEGSSLVVLEAMACGMPVITTMVGSGPDIAREIPEFVVPGPWERAPEQIVERLRTIERDHAHFSARAVEYVRRHHDRASWKQRWLDVLRTVLPRSPRRAAGRGL